MATFPAPLRSQQFSQGDSEDLEANPNRPSSSNSAEVLAPGVLQWEYGWTREWDGGAANASSLGGELRYGLTDRFEIRWGGGTFVTQSDGVQTVSGFGDQYLASQAELRKQGPLAPAVAVGYAIKFPTASAQNGLGTGRVDHSLTFLMSKNAHSFTIDFNTLAQVQGRAGTTGYDKNYVGILAVAHPIVGPLGAIGEVNAESRLNASTRGMVTNLWAVTYQVRKRLVLDCAVEMGLTRGAPPQRILFGFTYAIGKFAGRRTEIAANTATPHD